jgi:hypothetical protein
MPLNGGADVEKTTGRPQEILGSKNLVRNLTHHLKNRVFYWVMPGRFAIGFIPFVPLVFQFTFTCGALAAPPSPNAAAGLCVARAEGFLDGRLGFWQQRLNLADWKVSLVLSHANDLKPKTLGNIHWDANKKSAVIRVLDASDYRLACPDALSDMEMTLVHELVHLELASLPRSPASRHDEELAVNRIADALMRLERQEAQPAALRLKTETPRPREDASAPTW